MTPQDRSKPLHNFSLPSFKWGHQRVLRCVKVTDDPHLRSSSSIPGGFQPKPTNLETPKNHKPISIQENPISPDLRFNGVAKRLKVSPVEEERGNDDSIRPWNLRTRRAACKAPLRIEEKTNVDSPRKALEIDSLRRNATSSVKRQSTEPEKERVKFSVPLSKEEIEQDFMEICRIRPPRRPKKRPRIVQKYLDVGISGFFIFIFLVFSWYICLENAGKVEFWILIIESFSIWGLISLIHFSGLRGKIKRPKVFKYFCFFMFSELLSEISDLMIFIYTSISVLLL